MNTMAVPIRQDAEGRRYLQTIRDSFKALHLLWLAERIETAEMTQLR